VVPQTRTSTSPDGVEVGPATLADVDGITDVHTNSWMATYRGIVPDEFFDHLNREERVHYWMERLRLAHTEPHFVGVARAEGAVVGFAYACATTDEDDDVSRVGLIEYFHVDPGWWDRGVGRRLMAVALAWMSEVGFESASLWVVEANARARGFYEALGWKRDGSARLDRLAVGNEEGVELPALRYRTKLSNPTRAVRPPET
jgi:GNAT superfamily N-acetyltransferase